jgi:hypothetical protein
MVGERRPPVVQVILNNGTSISWHINVVILLWQWVCRTRKSAHVAIHWKGAETSEHGLVSL